MRIIPKKSKINRTLWKNYTISDFGLIFALIIIAYLIIMSNIRSKWILLFAFSFISITMFFENEDTRVYREITHMIKFLFATKKFLKNTKKKTKLVDNLIPQSKLRDDSIIEYGDYYGGVLAIGSTEFRLLNEWSQNQKISTFARILNSLTAEQSMQLVKIDRPINFDTIAKISYDKLNAAKQEIPQDYAKIAVLRSRLKQIDLFNNIEKQYRPYYYIVIYDDSLQSLQNILDYALSAFDDIGLAANRLSAKELAVFLKYCYTRNFDERDIDNISPEKYLDFVKPDYLKLHAYKGIELNDIQSHTFAISDYPIAVSNAWGTGVFNIDNTKVVLNLKPIDKDKAIKRIDRAVSEISTRENVNKASQIMAQDTHIDTMAGLMMSLQTENEMLFDCTMTVTGINHNKEQFVAFKKKIRRQIMADGFKIHSLGFRQFDGFISSSITRRNRLKSFERGINSESLAAVFPFVFTSIIEPNGLMLGYNNYPSILDIWKRELNKGYTNSNMFLLGRTGSGKSYMTKLLLELLYSDNCKIFMIDPENEYKELIDNFGGSFIDVGNATTGRLNPFHIYQILTEDGKAAEPDDIYWAHLRFLEAFFLVTLPGIPSEALEELNNLISKCYAMVEIMPDTDCSSLNANQFPTFDVLLEVIKNEINQEVNQLRINNLQLVETYIAKFATGGRNSNLWNGPSTLLADEKFIVLNFQSLLASKNNTVANGQILMVMRYLEQQIINIRELNRNSDVVIHPFVGIDEGLSLADTKFPVAVDFMYEWYRRIRKYDGSICMALQSLSPLVNNPEIAAQMSQILANSQYNFIFSVWSTDAKILQEIYQGAMNETEINEIITAKTGQCFLVSTTKDRTSFQVHADEDIVVPLFQKKLSENTIKELAGLVPRPSTKNINEGVFENESNINS